MSLHGIAIFTLRAAGFAAIVCGIYALILRMRGKALSAGRLLSVFYLASLIEITVLRGGIAWNDLFDARRFAVQWMPLKTTLAEFKNGAWPFIYHVGGNLAWFIPLGWVLRRKSAWAALLAGMLVSIAIECLQWVFDTGRTDVDDVIFNTCGTLLGYLLSRRIPMDARSRIKKG